MFKIDICLREGKKLAKPSIFSKDYEKRMKKRRRRIVLGVIFAIIVVLVIAFNTGFKDIDFSNLKEKMQAWVDSDKPQEELDETELKEDTVDIPKEEEKKYLDITIADGVILKAEYEEVEGKKAFVNVEPLEGMTFNISPSKDKIVINDKDQNVKVIGIDGSITDITKTAYISQSGVSYPKAQILAQTPTYIWQTQAKFIDENKIAYVSELPYFGNNGTKKYIWLYDLTTKSDKCIWSLVGNDVVVGDIVEGKGITISVNGLVYYLNSEGAVSQ